MDLSPQVVTRRRQWLADVLCDRAGAGDVPFADAAEAVRFAKSEGVLTLVAQGLQGRAADDPLRREFAMAAKGATAIAMLRGAECERVLAVLAEARIPVLLLKGSALAWSLYPAPHLRECSDIDLLLSSRQAVDRAFHVLSPYGFVRGYSQGGEAYECAFQRKLSETNSVDLDMHWQLLSVPVFANVFSFDELMEASRPLHGMQASGLCPVHAMLHACLHRAVDVYNGVPGRLKWLYDIHLLAQQLSPDEWRTLKQIAMDRGLCGILVEGFDATERWLDPLVPAEIMVGLRSARPLESLDATRLGDWHYMQRQNLMALPSIPRRIRWILRRIFPNASYMRELYGSHLGVASLLLVRARRLALRIRKV